ncbi:hypothetical protein ACFWN7_02045 [Agromyces sp. NPDC058484]|uniref:hypothetical protein n=1 Tax=Agromyces sp. NPDC058484 TaxID=3346524 RepID=UPI00366958ED
MANKTMFGFRLDRVTLHHGRTRQGQAFVDATLDGSPEETFCQSLESMRDRLVGVTRTGNLKYELAEDDRAPAELTDAVPTIRVESMAIGGSRVDFVVRIGRRGSHDLAIGTQSDEDVELGDLASTNPFLVSLYLPTAGTDAVLVSEVRSRTSAGYQLLKLIGVTSYESAASTGVFDNGQWWRLTSNPIGDVERLEEVLTQGNGLAFQLERHNAPKGKARSTDKVILRRNGLPASKLSSVKAMVLGWAKLDVPENYDDAPAGSPVEQLASLVGFDIEPALFDDGSLSYDDAQGRTQTIRPSNVGDVFIYPVAVGDRPTEAKTRAAAEDRVRRLQSSLRIPLSI